MWKMLPLVMIQWGAVAALFARSKQRNVVAWFAIGAVLPVIGTMIVMILPAAQPRVAKAKPRTAAVRMPISVGVVQLHRA
jgi:hypothetical protein